MSLCHFVFFSKTSSIFHTFNRLCRVWAVDAFKMLIIDHSFLMNIKVGLRQIPGSLQLSASWQGCDNPSWRPFSSPSAYLKGNGLEGRNGTRMNHLSNNFQIVGPLISLVPKEYLEDEDMEACKRCVLDLITMESRNAGLPLTSQMSRSKGAGPKRFVRPLWDGRPLFFISLPSRFSLCFSPRNEQFRTLYMELEYFLCRFVDLSQNHKKLLAWYLQYAGRRINTGDPRPDAERPTGLRLLDEKLREARVMWVVSWGAS